MVSSFHLISMEQEAFVKALKDPLTYGDDIDQVRLLQTHISFVALTDSYVYKIKKPVNFGFLDFSSLEKRRHFCEEEIRLNKRLCPDIYLDVVRITENKDASKLTINGTGDIVDYAVKMKQFSQENIMTTLLEKEQVTKDHIDSLCNILIDFYKRSDSTKEIDSYGTPSSVKQNIDENFEQTTDMIDITIPQETYNIIKVANERFFKDHEHHLSDRMINGHIRDCHGDLHSGNIVINDTNDICVFDCIEFNKRFRFIDVASDIGFLSMDLDFHNHFYLSSYLIQQYVAQGKDTSLFDVLNFYRSYRAYVRGKVIGFQLNDPHIEQEKRDSIITIAKKYYALSRYYAELFERQISDKRSIVFLVSGLTGTGKSTLASKLSIDYHAEILNTDIVRKKLAGIDTFERHHDEPNTGLYDPKNIQQTYQKVMELGSHFLKKKRNIILDATFQKRKHRILAQELAREHDAVFVPILCSCPEDIAKKWLDQRLHEQTASDGRWEIYQSMKKSFEPFGKDEDHITIDMSKEIYQDQMAQFQQILSFIRKR